MKYTVPAIPPSLNKYAGRKNAWEYRETKNKWLWIVRAACTPPKKPIEKALVSMVFFFPDNRRRDLDNNCKMLLDGLVAAKVIKDDCWQCVELHLRGDIDRERPRIEIQIEKV